MANGEILLPAVPTLASVHDTPAASHLLKSGVRKIMPLYTAMETAYDALSVRTLCHNP